RCICFSVRSRCSEPPFSLCFSAYRPLYLSFGVFLMLGTTVLSVFSAYGPLYLSFGVLLMLGTTVLSVFSAYGPVYFSFGVFSVLGTTVLSVFSSCGSLSWFVGIRCFCRVRTMLLPCCYQEYCGGGSYAMILVAAREGFVYCTRFRNDDDSWLLERACGIWV
ncbi:unnamed protein product, partial [Ectocarpus sp. 4 AP-2014]